MKVRDRLRSATVEDIESLIVICRECFPESLRWRSPARLGVRWWERVLSCHEMETALFARDGEILGFIVVVSPSNENSLASVSSHGWVSIARVEACLRHPILAFRKVIGQLITRSMKRGGRVADEGIDTGEFCWIELLGVCSKARGTKIGYKLLDWCSSYVTESGAQGVRLSVRSDNMRARRFYENAGFTCLSRGNDALVCQCRFDGDQ